MNESKVPYITLSDGGMIPQLGFGTWTLSDDAEDAVDTAIKAGYRLIDTASMYGNEEAVGRGIRKSGIDRESLFVTTKITPSEMSQRPQSQWIEESLERLDIGWIDLMLFHWPAANEKYHRETWDVLEEYAAKGLIKHLGVSNFNPRQIDDLLIHGHLPPVVNQIELYPYRQQIGNVKADGERNIAIECYSPLAEGRAAKDPVLEEIAKAHGKTAAQVTLRWEIQKGFITIPKGRNPAHIQSNMDIWDFALTEKEMETIASLNEYTSTDPEDSPW